MKKTILAICTIGTAFLIAGCSPNSAQLESNSNQPANQTVASGNQNSGQTAGNSTGSSQTTGGNATASISFDDAIAIYKKQYPNTDITSIDIKTSQSGTYYEVSGVDDDKEYEINVNGNDGSVRLDREETLDADERNGVERENEKLDLSNLLSLDKISDIAKKEAKSDTIYEWSLDRELSTTYWEVSLQENGKEISVSIDAHSGNVLEVEYDD